MMERSEPALLLPAVLAGTARLPAGQLNRDAWTRLVDDAAVHQVAPLVWRRLNESGDAEHLPAEARQRLEAEHTLAALRARSWRAQLDAILEVLAADSIEVTTLKGVHLAIHLYGFPAARPMADLDLLIRPEQGQRAMEAIVRLGYARPAGEAMSSYAAHRHYPPLKRRGRLPVELHTTVDPCEPPFRLSLEDVWARTQPDEMLNSGTRVLCAEDLLLHLSTHMGYSHLLGSSLVRVCDIAVWLDRFSSEVDWDAIVSRSRASGTGKFVYSSLELARRVLGAQVPEAARVALRTDANDVAVDAATRLLVHPWRVLPDMLLLSRSGTPVWSAIRRVTAGLLLPPARHRSGAPDPVDERDVLAGRSRYRERWKAALHAAGSPLAARDALRGLRQVRQLWAWAREQPESL